MLSNLDDRLRPLITAIICGLVIVLLPSWLPLPTRVILGWDSGAVCLLALILLMILNATPQKMRRRAQTLNASRWAILTVTIAAACASLLAIGLMLKSTPKGSSPSLVTLHLTLSAVTIVCSWVLIHTMFALRYAHSYYRPHTASSTANEKGGLIFPNRKQPDYWDFLYFSFVIGMTSQVSDVQVASSQMRILALVHGVLSFFFNTIIVALSINLIAGML